MARHSSAAIVGCYLGMPGFQFSCWLRIAQWLRNGGRDNRGFFRNILFRIAQVKARRLGYRFGFDIPVSCKLGHGLKLGHFGGTVFQGEVELGDNCLISHGVTIGRNPRGKRKGTPVLGDRVYVGAGAVIAGGIQIGNDVLIAPNAFVNFDVPDGSVVVGNPGRVVSQGGVDGYIRFRWPPEAA